MNKIYLVANRNSDNQKIFEINQEIFDLLSDPIVLNNLEVVYSNNDFYTTEKFISEDDTIKLEVQHSAVKTCPIKSLRKI